jgi:hypothetical protein
MNAIERARSSIAHLSDDRPPAARNQKPPAVGPVIYCVVSTG